MYHTHQMPIQIWKNLDQEDKLTPNNLKPTKLGTQAYDLIDMTGADDASVYEHNEYDKDDSSHPDLLHNRF